MGCGKLSGDGRLALLGPDASATMVNRVLREAIFPRSMISRPGGAVGGRALVEPVELRPVVVPEPSVEAWERFSNLLELARTDRKAFEARCKFRRKLVAAHRSSAHEMRKRGAEYDAAVAASREVWIAEHEMHEAIVRMQTGL